MKNELPMTQLPGRSGKMTSRIGLGIATLMREGSRSARERVFDAAYASGVRHFDVAPLYGLGAAEKELGRLLTRVPGDVTVATKFGLRPSSSARLAAKIQGPLRMLIGRSGGLRSFVRKHSVTAVPVPVPSNENLRTSVSRSLDQLGIGRIDVLLLHDLVWTPDLGRLWEDLREAGELEHADALGVTGHDLLLDGYPSEILENADILQLPSNSKITLAAPKGLVIEYGLLSTSLSRFNAWLDCNESERRALEILLDQGLRSTGERASFLAAMALTKDDKSILLIGTTKVANIQHICAGVSRFLPALAESELDVRKLLETTVESGSLSFLNREE